jgi:hypothetical protein
LEELAPLQCHLMRWHLLQHHGLVKDHMQNLSFHYAVWYCYFLEKWQMFESMDSCQRFIAALAVHCFAYNFGDATLHTSRTVFLRERENKNILGPPQRGCDARK